MHVYKLDSNVDDFKAIDTIGFPDLDICQRFRDSTSIAGIWRPFEILVMDEFKKCGKKWKAKPVGDFPWLNSVMPILSVRAVEALRDLLEPYGELLPLSGLDDGFMAYHVMNEIDALDIDRSEVSKYDDIDVMYRVDRYAFKKEVIVDSTIFRLPAPMQMRVYVQDQFVERVQQSGLIGFDLPLLWSE